MGKKLDKKGDTKFGSMAPLQFGALNLVFWPIEKEFDENENESCVQKVKLIKGLEMFNVKSCLQKVLKNVLKMFHVRLENVLTFCW